MLPGGEHLAERYPSQIREDTVPQDYMQIIYTYLFIPVPFRKNDYTLYRPELIQNKFTNLRK